MTYDFHGTWESVSGHHSPLYKGSQDTGDNVYLNTVSTEIHFVYLHHLMPTLSVSFPLSAFPSIFIYIFSIWTGKNQEGSLKSAKCYSWLGCKSVSINSKSVILTYEVCDVIVHQSFCFTGGKKNCSRWKTLDDNKAVTFTINQAYFVFTSAFTLTATLVITSSHCDVFVFNSLMTLICLPFTTGVKALDGNTHQFDLSFISFSKFRWNLLHLLTGFCTSLFIHIAGLCHEVLAGQGHACRKT